MLRIYDGLKVRDWRRRASGFWAWRLGFGALGFLGVCDSKLGF